MTTTDGCFYADPSKRPTPCNCPGCRMHGHGGALMPRPLDFAAFADDKSAWSERTFGPGERTAGVLDHIRKELIEIERDPADLSEWVDVIILAMDGAWRSAGADGKTLAAALVAKMDKNKARTWPDWRTAPRDKAIEHDRSDEGKP